MNYKNDIYVDYLCNEPFWKFTKKGESQYCKVCRHQIKDFTNLDKKSTIDSIKQFGGETCGMFYKDQFIVDDSTQKVTKFKTILLAGGLSTFLTINLNAQDNKQENIKIEQRTNFNPAKSNNLAEQDTAQVCMTYTSDELVSNTTAYKKHNYIKVGSTRIFINWRFPFLHLKTMKKGRIRYRAFN